MRILIEQVLVWGLNEQNYKLNGKPGIKLLYLLKTLLKVSKNKLLYILVQNNEITTRTDPFPKRPNYLKLDTYIILVNILK